MIAYKFELGTFVVTKNNPKKLYIVVKRGSKHGNHLYICLPVIDKGKRTQTDRYIYSIFKNKVIVLNKEERFASFQLEYKQARMSNEITNKIIEKYKHYDPNLYDIERPEYSTSDGLRSGNPWQGMDMMKQRPKVYKG